MRQLLLLLALFLIVTGYSQTTVFQEDFEGATIQFTSSAASGTTSWALSDSYSTSGTYSDSATVAANDYLYLTSNSFNTTGNYDVVLEFSQICKIEFFDSAYIEVSNDNGISWTRVTQSMYLGSTPSAYIYDKFSSGSYPIWDAATNNATPTNAWWMPEQFDISSLAANSANVKIRFVLADGNINGANGARGWFIDDVKVDMAVDEMIPPAITLLPPIQQDTVYGGGPFNVTASIQDTSGVDTAMIIYTYYPENITDTVGMTMIAPDTFQGDIPFQGFGRTYNYIVKAIDSSILANENTTNQYSFFNKFSSGGGFQIGNGTATNTTTSYPSPYGNFYFGNKEQYLILASELQALGVPGGPISSLAFEVDNVNNCPGLNNFTIKMGATTDNALSTWVSGLTQVYTNVSYQPATGWNTHSFSNNFVWNGSSNIVVEVCFNNSSYQQNASVKQHTTTFNSTLSFHVDNAIVCSTTGMSWGFPAMDRPNMQIEVAGVANTTNDVGVYSFVSPSGGVLANMNFDVKVDLKNFGIDTITSANIDWEIDGTMQTAYSFSDSLFPDSISNEITLGNLNLANGVHNIKAWTSNPNGNPDFNIANDTIELDFYACANLLNGTYTIGGSGADYPTFADAILALNQCGISGPVTFNVAAGTYNEQVLINTISGSSAVNTVTFQSAAGDSSSVVLSYNATTASDNYVVKLNETSFIEFKEITFEAMDSTYAQVFHLKNNVHDFSLLNNVIKTTNQANIDDETMALIYVSDSLGSNIDIQNNLFKNGSYAFTAGGLSNNASNWNVSNNIFDGHYASAIYIRNAESATVKYNYIEPDSMMISPNYSAIVLDHNHGSAEVSYNHIIVKYSEVAYGIGLTYSNFDSLNPAMVYNNKLSIFVSSGLNNISAGIINNETKNASYYFNTIHLRGNHTTSAPFVAFDNAGLSDNLIIKNNLLTSNASGYLMYISGISETNFSNNYNNLYGDSLNAFAYLGSDISDLNDWKAQTSDAQNTTNYNPNYPDFINLEAANNYLNNTATPISGITDDFNGDARNATNPDVGADEFDASAYDIAVLEMLNPSSACGLDSNEQVTIRIKNIGSSVINGNLTAKYKFVQSSSTVSESITTTINPTDTLDFTFSTDAIMDATPFGVDTIFNLVTWCELTNDPYQNNDTVYKDVTSGYVPPIPVATDTNVTYNNSITLTAQSNDTLIWYADDSTFNELYKGNFYTTPILYDTTTYYVAALGGGLAAYNTIGSGTATQNYAPAYGYYDYSWSSIIYESSEIPNPGTIDSISFHVSNTPSSYTMLDQRIYMEMTSASSFSSAAYPGVGNKQLVYQGSITYNGSGWHTIALQTPFEYDGSKNLIIYTENHDGSYTTGYPNFTSSPATSKVIYNFDDVTFPTGLGSDLSNRPNIKIYTTPNGCPSGRVPLTVIVDSIPLHDIGLISMSSPHSGIELTAAEPITVTIKNFAAIDKDTLPVAFQLDTLAIVYDTLYHTLVQNDSVQFTLNHTLDLSAFDTFDLVIYTNLDYDINSANDTITRTIINSPLQYCDCTPTSSSYEDITYVEIGDLSNSTLPSGNMYNDYTMSVNSANMTLGQTYNAVIGTDYVNSTIAYNVWINVFIDYNRDGVFDATTENVFNGSSNSSDTISGTITIPFNNVVTALPTRMRVVMRESGNIGNTGPCGTFTWGEVEDYFVTFAQPIPNDAGVLEVIIADTINEYSATNVDAVVRNFGTDTIFNMDIEYTVNNGTAIATTFNDTLIPQQIDTITLNTFTAPAGSVDICAYTVLSGDSNAFNDGSCINVFGVPVKDAKLISVVELSEGCNLTYDSLRILITNIGIDTINGGVNNPTTLTAYYQKVGGTVVSETVNTVIYPGDTVLFEFYSMPDFSTNNLVDTIYEVNIWLDYVGDNVNYNDSAFTTVESLHTPSKPTVTSPVTINYASPAVLSAVSSDSVYWYYYETSNNIVATGSPYITPLIYADSTYWVEAKGGAAGGYNEIGTGTVTQNYAPAYGFYDYGWSSIIYESSEVANFGRIDSISFYIDNSVVLYTMIDQRIYMSTTTNSAHPNNAYPGTTGKQLVFQGDITYDGTGWFTIVLDNPFVYDGNENLLIYVENHDGDWSSGYPNWRSTNKPGKVIYDIQDNSFPTTSGSSTGIRPNIKFFASPLGCPSIRDSINIMVNPQMANDVSAFELISPTTGNYLTTNETVTLRVKNFGTASQSNIPVSYSVNGGAVVNETVPGPIPANDSVDYTFTQTADLSSLFTNYNVQLNTALSNDGNTTNDTINVQVTNNSPNYCISRATSHYGNNIINVDFAGINNASSAGGYTMGYSDFTQTAPANVLPSQTYQITIQCDTSVSYDNGFVEIYMDLNKDGAFTQPDEIIFGQAYNNASSTAITITGDINIPYNALQGQTRMRIVNELSWSSIDSSDVDPCTTYSYGETEDYMLLVGPPAADDIGVEEILSPQIVTDLPTQNLSVVMRNYGSNQISNFKLYYSVNTNLDSMSFNTPSPLSLGDDYTANFGNITLSQGLNQIYVYSDLAGDTNTFNDSSYTTSYLEVVLNAPYIDKFDDSITVWFPDTVNNQWEWGAPAGQTLNSAHSSPNVWATRLSSTYEATPQLGDFLYSPKFLISNTIDSLELKFWHMMDMDGNDNDIATLQWSESGSNWQSVGISNDPKGTNWFDTTLLGTPSFSTTNNGWMQSAYLVDFLNSTSPFNGVDTIQFRFVFVGDGSATHEGWMIDDFSFALPQIAIDAHVMAINAPADNQATGSVVYPKVEVYNAGTQPLTSIDMSFEINGNGNIKTETWTLSPGLSPGSTAEFTFSNNSYTSPATDYSIFVEADASGDIYHYNDTMTKFVNSTAADYDAMASLIVNPGDTTGLNYSPWVTIQIKNVGVNALTSIPVEYTVFSQTVSEVWNGTLPPGDSAYYTFTQTYSSQLGNYQICVRTALTNDGNPANDEICKSVVGVVNHISTDDIESGFILGQNQPNPALGKYEIEYELPNSGQIHFEIRNSLGQIIYKEEGFRKAGVNSLKLNASDLANGVYYYSMDFDKVRKTRKMVITK